MTKQQNFRLEFLTLKFRISSLNLKIKNNSDEDNKRIAIAIGSPTIVLIRPHYFSSIKFLLCPFLSLVPTPDFFAGFSCRTIPVHDCRTNRKILKYGILRSVAFGLVSWWYTKCSFYQSLIENQCTIPKWNDFYPMFSKFSGFILDWKDFLSST